MHFQYIFSSRVNDSNLILLKGITFKLSIIKRIKSKYMPPISRVPTRIYVFKYSDVAVTSAWEQKKFDRMSKKFFLVNPLYATPSG